MCFYALTKPCFAILMLQRLHTWYSSMIQTSQNRIKKVKQHIPEASITKNPLNYHMDESSKSVTRKKVPLLYLVGVLITAAFAVASFR